MILQTAPRPFEFCDDSLPSLAGALDTNVMRDVFDAHFTAMYRHRIEVTECARLQTRYRPGRSCVIGYSVTVRELVSGRTETLLYSGTVYRRGEAARRFSRIAMQPWVAPRVGPPALLAGELDLVLLAFPNDRKIAHLPALMASADRLPAIQALDVIRYVPEHTCTIRATIGGEPGLRMFGKVYYDDEGAETFRNMTALSEAPAVTSGALRLASPLLYEPGLRILWQEAIDGQPVAACVPDAAEVSAILRAAGAAFAWLHASPIAATRSSSLADSIENIEDAARKVAAAFPEFAPPAGRLRQRLLGEALEMPFTAEATLHGDPHLKNVLRTPGGVALIDLDNVRRGDIHEDIGSFIAGSCHRSLSGNPVEEIESFLEGYRSATPFTLDPQALRWHCAKALLVERVLRGLTRFKIVSRAAIGQLLNLALDVADGRGIGEVI